MANMALDRILSLSEDSQSYATYSYEKLLTFSSDLSEKYRTYLSPDSNRYYSHLSPLFSFELESSIGNHLKSFEVISLRDGVWPLLRFFAINPTPHEIDPVLVIDSSLSSLVPPEWRGKVVLRNLFFEKEIIFKKRSKTIIFISPDQKSNPLDMVKKRITELQQHIPMGQELYFYFSSGNLMGEEDAEKEDNWGYRLMLLFTESFSGRKMHILNWEEYLSLPLNSFNYFSLNILNFIFSDSYLIHDAAQRGARPLIESSGNNNNDDFRVNISVNHGFELHCRFDDYFFPDYQSNFKKLFPGSIFEETKRDDLAHVKLSTLDFKDWASDVAGKVLRSPKV
jgi:hypothetical protein